MKLSISNHDFHLLKQEDFFSVQINYSQLGQKLYFCLV
jgi:hypothetical protein